MRALRSAALRMSSIMASTLNLQSATRTDGIAAATLMYPCSFIFYSLTYARTICST